MAAAASRLLARGGLDGVTVREVAAEAGSSTHVVSHYFDGKSELLLFTLREASGRSVERMKAAMKAGLDLTACLETLLPLDEERLADVRIWTFFWAGALSDPALEAELKKFGTVWRHLFAGLIDLHGHGENADADAIEMLAQRLQAVVAGIGMYGVLGALSPGRQRALLHVSVRSILRPPAPEAAVSETPEGALATENKRLRRFLADLVLRNAELEERLAAAGAALDVDA
ncbi:TetR/AcrR family transcriptional regulator [Sphingomonas profundi]|uniref:TetR/AcrR family transcriptional regulator n=1 Tax=Alterirhizorhabdus profundi TaxID=2681549 RepID=UPI001E5C7ED9|nr:TetR/AcrR family transcriptional regulator [Sphingomonas profundi]